MTEEMQGPTLGVLYKVDNSLKQTSRVDPCCYPAVIREL